jgi:hypothetical protein
MNIYYIFPIIFCLGLSYVAIQLDNYLQQNQFGLFLFFFNYNNFASLLTIPMGWVMPIFKILFFYL